MKSIFLRIVCPALLIFAATFALFYPALSFSLVNYDDPVFIIHNPIVFNGFSWDAVRQAFTELHGDKCMYVPLLWISYLLDVEFLGASPVNPWGFHFANVLLHALNSVLLFFLLLGFCRKPWRAFFFAALWALHPLRVESVAWVTERKDVLSAFFAFLCIGAYLLARRRRPAAKPDATPRSAWPLPTLSFLSYVCGMLVKPMLVTIPFLLLLLDVWPLRRVEPEWHSGWRAAPRLLLEKWPFFLGAFAAAAGVYLTQSATSISSAPLLARLYCIPSNYLFYLGKFFVPLGLFAMVPRTFISIGDFLLAVGVLGAASAWVWTRRRKRPHELVGWLAFLGLLFPVAGIVLIGVYPVADRYSYLPAIGLSIAFLHALPAGGNGAAGRAVRAVLGVGALAGLALLTMRLLPSWKNNENLYAHIARQSPGHYAALNHQAREALYVQGDFETADRLADRLLQLKPNVSFGLTLKIVCLSQLESAEAAWTFAQAHYPPFDNATYPGLYENYLAILALLTGRHDDSARYLQDSLRLSVFEPKSQEQLHALAMLLEHERGHEAVALDHAAHIASLRNKTRLAQEDMFIAYTTLWAGGFYAQILPRFQELARTHPDRPDLLNNVAWLLATTAGSPADPAEILAMVRQALAKAPDHAVIQDTLAVAQANAGDFDAALETARKLAAMLAFSPANDAPALLQKVRHRIALYQERKPYREHSASRLLYAP